MIKRKWLLLILLSAALNISFVAAWAINALPEKIGAESSPEPAADSGESWCPMHRRLGADDEQLDRIEPRMRRFNECRREISESLGGLHNELIDLIAAENPDMRAIETVQEKILAKQREMQNLVVQNLLAEKKDLTPEQQEAFFRMLRRRSPGQGGQMRGRNEGHPAEAPRGGPGRRYE